MAKSVSTRAPSSIFRFPRGRRSVDLGAAGRTLIRTFRIGFGSLSSVAPDFSAACAEWLFRCPPHCAPLVRERRTLEAGERHSVPHGSGRLAAWRFGSGPAIVTAHGWGGHAGRLSSFFQPLVEAGFSVVAFDAPGHGESSGSLSSLPDFVAALESVAHAFGPVAGVIGHSAGAAAAALAIRRGAPISRAVLLAPPADPDSFAARFANHVGISPSVRDAMKRRLETRYGMGWSDLNLSEPTSVPAEILVLHDRNDASVPWKQGFAVVAAWPGARLVSTRGLGHHKIIRDRNVVATAVRFLSASCRSALRNPAADAGAAVSAT